MVNVQVVIFIGSLVGILRNLRWFTTVGWDGWMRMYGRHGAITVRRRENFQFKIAQQNIRR